MGLSTGQTTGRVKWQSVIGALCPRWNEEDQCERAIQSDVPGVSIRASIPPPIGPFTATC